MRALVIAMTLAGAPFAPAHAEPLAPGVLDFDILEDSVRQEPCVSAFYGSPTGDVVCVEYARIDAARMVTAYRQAIRSAGWTTHNETYRDAYYQWYSRREDDGTCTALHHNYGPRLSDQDWIAANVPDLGTNEAIHRALTDQARRFTMLFRFTRNHPCDVTRMGKR